MMIDNLVNPETMKYGIVMVALVILYVFIKDIASPLLKKVLKGRDANSIGISDAAVNANVAQMSASINELTKAISMMVNENHLSHREILQDTATLKGGIADVKSDIGELRRSA